jgi:hypothetical protein
MLNTVVYCENNKYNVWKNFKVLVFKLDGTYTITTRF